MGEQSLKSTSTYADAEYTTQIGVGIVPGDDQASLIHTSFRARSRDFTVFVFADSVEDPLKDLLSEVGITILETPARSQDDAEQALVKAAKAADCPGLIVCDPGAVVDFEASSQRVAEATAFSIDAVPAEPETTGRLVGIPAYNESVGIGSTILAAQEFADEVVVIDDGSADNTVELVRWTDATLLEHETNKGKGQALQTFFEYARASDHESYVVLDGDGQHLPRDIPAVVDPVENGEADLVVGSRYLEDGTGDETPFHRRVGQQVLDYLTFGSSGTKLTDTQSGFRAFSPAAIETLSIRTDGMGVESEMITSAQDAGLTIEERSIDVRYEGIDGQTLNPLQHGLSVATFLLQLIRDRHPLLFFGVPGVLIAGVGVLLGLQTVVVFNTQGIFLLARTLVSLLLTVIGLLGIFCGLVLNRISNMLSELTEEVQ